MKGKILFFGLSALALAVTACSLDETTSVNDENAIKFKAVVPNATRATATTAASLDQFQVWAFDADGSAYMNHVVATNNGSGTYTTTPTYFWPDGTLDFVALYPVGDVTSTGVAIPEGATNPVATAEISDVSGTITGTLDVTVPVDAADQIDLVYAETLGVSSGSSVAMNFRHALSQVVFQAKNTNTDVMTVTIAGVRVGSVYSEGTYTLPSVGTTTNLAGDNSSTSSISGSQGTWSEPTSTTAKTSFTALALEDEYIAVDSVPVQLTSSSEGTALFMIPQEVEAWDVLTDHHDTGLGAYFLISCNIKEGDAQIWPNSNEAVDGTTPTYAEIAVPCDIAWEQGYKYTYTFVFGEGAGYYPPDDENDPQSSDPEATPVLVPITFTVSVDEFQSADDLEVSTNASAITVYSLSELEAAMAAGYTDITIAAGTRITLEDKCIEFNYSCTLTIEEGAVITASDADGETYYIPHGDNGETGYSAAIYVNGCNVTLNGGGTVTTTGTETSYYTDAVWVVNGSVTINGGVYQGSHWNTTAEYTGSALWAKHAVYCGEGGFAYIYGGTFSAGNTVTSSRNECWALNCHNTSWQNGHAMIWCYGGTYLNGFDPDNPQTDDADSYVAEGYESVYDQSTDSYTVQKIQ